MTGQNKIYLLLLTFLQLFTVQGQEIIKKKKYKDGISEEFYVLKENKEIKQFESLTTYTDILDKKYIIEYGQYDKNRKTGTWFTFYINPSNFLKSKGNYKEDKKDGLWRYYYPGSSSARIGTLLGDEKRTNIIKSPKDVKGFKIELDSTGQQIMCTGRYSDDTKVGTWDYYSRLGYLLHKFDHSSQKFLLNNLREPHNDFLIFIGGQERFNNYYYAGQQEIKIKSAITKTSEVSYEIDKNGNYKFIQGYGDEVFKNHVDQILETIPQDWVYLNPSSTKKLQIISKVVFTENTFKRYKFTLEFKVAN